MRALPCTKHRRAVMQLVLDGMIFTGPVGKTWPGWRQAGQVPTARTESRALGELLAARLIRISAAVPRSSDAKGARFVFATDQGRTWAEVGYRARRGTSNTNSRGSAKGRRARKQWLLDTYGDGDKAECWLAVPGVCTGPMTFETLTVERVTPGHAGGTYRRNNIRPACGSCQSYQGGRIGQERLRGIAARDLNS